MTTAGGVAAAREVLNARAVDLVVLDLRMSGEDGRSFARELRGRSGVAIVMLTASGEIVDRVVGLELGADDYVAKPFDPRELLARIRSVLRRVQPEPTPKAAGTQRNIWFGRHVLDLPGRVQEQSNGALEPSLPSVPAVWRPWFAAVDEAFRSSRRHLAQARDEEARKSAVLEAAFDSIITTDEAGRVLELNDGAERTFGFDRSEALGRSIGDLIVPPHLRERHG